MEGAQLDFTLSEEQKLLQSIVREFVDREIKPNADEWNKARRVPVEIFEQLAKMGLMGPLVPEQYGGSDMGTIAFSIILMELSRGDASVGALYGGHATLGSLPLLSGSDEVKELWLRQLAEGKHLGAFALSEPDTGSDVRSIKTSAVRDGDNWLISGSKIMITNANTPMSYGAVVLAVTGQDEKGKKSFTGFVVPNETPGYRIGQEFEKMGWHGADTCEIIFENCSVPDSYRLGEVGSGLKPFYDSLEAARISLSSQSVGLAQACLDESIKYALERIQFGRPIADFQAIRFKIARMATDIELARLVTFKAAWMRDQNQSIKIASSMAKLFAGEMVKRAADDAVQIHGGYGFMEDYLVSRYYRDARVFSLGGGSSEIHHLIIARELLGGSLIG
jgi:butyryl-CoA dehydrogenase